MKSFRAQLQPKEGFVSNASTDLRTLRSCRDALQGSRCLLRVDYNVPIDESGAVRDATRIHESMETIKTLLSHGAKVTLISHMGRPTASHESVFSLRSIVPTLETMINQRVQFIAEHPATEALTHREAYRESPVVLLENLRYDPGEEQNSPEFSRTLASLGEFYVNDAFSVCHRAHASTVGVTRFLPSYAGIALEANLNHLTKVLRNPERPCIAVMGGAKISTKIGTLGALSRRVDAILLGGGLAYTMMRARGLAIGKSLCQNDMLDQAKALWDEIEFHHCRLELPIDGTGYAHSRSQHPQTFTVETLPSDGQFFDVGPRTIHAYTEWFKRVKTVVWNGPLGMFEHPPFDQGTIQLAQVIADRTRQGSLRSVVGGGDTLAALKVQGGAHRFTAETTAGGAFLKWLEGKPLPGLQPLYNTIQLKEENHAKSHPKKPT